MAVSYSEPHFLASALKDGSSCPLEDITGECDDQTMLALRWNVGPIKLTTWLTEPTHHALDTAQSHAREQLSRTSTTVALYLQIPSMGDAPREMQRLVDKDVIGGGCHDGVLAAHQPEAICIGLYGTQARPMTLRGTDARP